MFQSLTGFSCEATLLLHIRGWVYLSICLACARLILRILKRQLLTEIYMRRSIYLAHFKFRLLVGSSSGVFAGLAPAQIFIY